MEITIPEKVKSLTNSYTDIDETRQTLRLTYDCGDSQDVESFENQIDKILESINIQNFVSVSTLPSYETEEDERNDINCWYVVDVNVNYKTLTIDNIEELVTSIDQIC